MSGYKLIDLKGQNINTTGVTIPGIYNAIEESYKAILLDNVYINSIEYKPYYPEISVSNTKFVFGIPGVTGYHVEIASTNVCKYVAD